jgi:hypothetical protein
MRYWQVTTRRLSSAAQKLDMDGEWHPFASTPHSWYRVWKKKLIQRVAFRDQAEEDRLLEQITPLEPLEDLVQTAGFREEIDIEELDRGLALIGLLGYPTQIDKRMGPLLKRNGMALVEKEGLLFIAVPVSALEKPIVMSAQERLAAARMFYQAITMHGSPAWEPAVMAFENTLRSLEEMEFEQAKPKKGRSRRAAE